MNALGNPIDSIPEALLFGMMVGNVSIASVLLLVGWMNRDTTLVRVSGAISVATIVLMIVTWII